MHRPQPHPSDSFRLLGNGRNRLLLLVSFALVAFHYILCSSMPRMNSVPLPSRPIPLGKERARDMMFLQNNANLQLTTMCMDIYTPT